MIAGREMRGKPEPDEREGHCRRRRQTSARRTKGQRPTATTRTQNTRPPNATNLRVYLAVLMRVWTCLRMPIEMDENAHCCFLGTCGHTLVCGLGLRLRCAVCGAHARGAALGDYREMRGKVEPLVNARKRMSTCVSTLRLHPCRGENYRRPAPPCI